MHRSSSEGDSLSISQLPSVKTAISQVSKAGAKTQSQRSYMRSQLSMNPLHPESPSKPRRGEQSAQTSAIVPI